MERNRDEDDNNHNNNKTQDKDGSQGPLVNAACAEFPSLTGAQHPVTARMEPSQNEDHNKNKDKQDKDKTSQGPLVKAVRSSPL